MNSLSEEIKLLARLEIESVLENNQLGEFAIAIEEIFNFPMSTIVSDYFIEGAVFGVSLNEDTSVLDKDLFILGLHERMRKLLNQSNLEETKEEEAVVLFEKLFLQGLHWYVAHKINNQDEEY